MKAIIVYYDDISDYYFFLNLSNAQPFSTWGYLSGKKCYRYYFIPES